MKQGVGKQRSVRWCGVVLAVVLLLMPQMVQAASYGSDTYGDCGYQACTRHTVQTLPSGLQVAVNLVNGQSIPLSGYVITVTPLNGQGESFQYVDFYIDGQLAQAGVAPDATGTAAWEWDPTHYPGSVVRVVVTDVDGTVITQQFTVHVADEKTPMPVESATGLTLLLQHAAAAGSTAIKALPRPVVYGFPYLLFVLLGVNALVLLVQAQKELREYRTLGLLLARMRNMEEGKRTFLELVSHYLRTPLTMIAGGIDMVAPQTVPVRVMNGLQAANTHLHTTVEALIAQCTPPTTTAAESHHTVPVARWWQQPGLFLPVGLIGALAFTFTYLTARAGAFTISEVTVALQIILFSGLVLITIQVFRRRQLRRRDVRLTQHIMTEQKSMATSRDTLIIQAAGVLSDDLKRLGSLLAQMPSSQATTFIRTGYGRFQDVLAKFTLVAGLHGGHSDKAFHSVAVSELLAAAQSRLQAVISTRHVTVDCPSADVRISLQERELVALVLHILLNNALAYSPEYGRVEVQVQSGQTSTAITVIDHGPGIPTERQSLLFQPFSKTEDVETFNHEGIGLGLYIARLVMTYIGGTCTLRSKPGKTTVTLQVPVS